MQPDVDRHLRNMGPCIAALGLPALLWARCLANLCNDGLLNLRSSDNLQDNRTDVSLWCRVFHALETCLQI